MAFKQMTTLRTAPRGNTTYGRQTGDDAEPKKNSQSLSGGKRATVLASLYTGGKCCPKVSNTTRRLGAASSPTAYGEGCPIRNECCNEYVISADNGRRSRGRHDKIEPQHNRPERTGPCSPCECPSTRHPYSRSTDKTVIQSLGAANCRPSIRRGGYVPRLRLKSSKTRLGPPEELRAEISDDCFECSTLTKLESSCTGDKRPISPRI